MKKLHILFLSILPALVILFCFLGFLAAPNDPEEVVITQSFLAPCAEYPLGTDQYGRCVLSRILYGGYTTLGIVLMGSAIVMTVGILLGLLLGQGKAGRNYPLEGVHMAGETQSYPSGFSGRLRDTQPGSLRLPQCGGGPTQLDAVGQAAKAGENR